MLRPTRRHTEPREHPPHPCLRGPAGRAADLRPAGRPGREGARSGGGAALGVEPAAGARHGGRGLRSATHLRADDEGDQHRRGAGLHDRTAQHASLRAALDRDPRRRRVLRQDGHHHRVRTHRHRLRHRPRAGPQPRLGDQPGRGAGARQGAAPARPDPRRGVGRGRGADQARADAGRDPAHPRTQRAPARGRGERDPRPAAGSPGRGGGGPERRAAGRRPGGAARGGPGRRSSASSRTRAQPTSWRRWTRTTRPT